MKFLKKIIVFIFAIVLLIPTITFIKFFSFIALIIYDDIKQPTPQDIKEYVADNIENITDIISEIDKLKVEYNSYGFGNKISRIGYTDKTTEMDDVTGLYLYIDNPYFGGEYKEINNVLLENLFHNTFIDGIEVFENALSFECGGRGIGSETTYYGFSYSNIDSPDVLNNYKYPQDAHLLQDENGYIWKEPDGDNYFYTEKVIDNFYYYEEHF